MKIYWERHGRLWSARLGGRELESLRFRRGIPGGDTGQRAASASDLSQGSGAVHTEGVDRDPGGLKHRRV